MSAWRSLPEEITERERREAAEAARLEGLRRLMEEEWRAGDDDDEE